MNKSEKRTVTGVQGVQGYCFGPLSARLCEDTLRSLRNDDDDGYGNAKKQQYDWLKEEEMIALHVRHAFLYIPLPNSLKQQRKMTNFRF